MQNIVRIACAAAALILGTASGPRPAAARADAPDQPGTTVHGFKLLAVQSVPEINSTARRFEHVKTGAQLLYLSNSDDNKVFMIAFHTPPTDDTGVAHVLEHSVLCGSQRFPSKEPFVELLKGSLQTFLNAFTANDRTMYPVASRNDKDFVNLMNVYLDAVFYPRLHSVPEIMMQEGWHYEIDRKSGAFSYNGVVYNEMKGALSSPERLLSQTIENSLFPEGTYGHNSGGDPRVIPTLTRAKFTAFHKRYYHPSNSLIFLYGSGDVAKHLAFLDDEYLGRFDRQQIDAKVIPQPPFAAPREVAGRYSIDHQDSEQDKTFLSLSYVLGGSPDPDVYFGMDILSYLLVDSQAAPLRRALISAGIGKDVEGQLENSILQPYFSVIVKNSNADKKEQFLQIVDKTLRDLAEKGIDRRLIEAAVNRKEFALRESEMPRFPKGLVIGMRVLDSWTYGAEPTLFLKYEPVLRRIREAVPHGYFEQLIRTRLLDNRYRAVVVLQPEKGLDRRNAEKARAELAKLRDSMPAAELDGIKQATQKLKLRQAAPDRPEDLATIPTLRLSDLQHGAEKLPLAQHKLGGATVLNHSLPTSQIAYVGLYFDARTVPPELVQYVPLLASVLGKVGTAKRGYQDFCSEVDIQTGGIHCDVAPIADKSASGAFYPKFVVSSKAMLPKLPNLLALVSEMLLTARLDDKPRLKEILQESVVAAERAILERGHTAAYVRAASCVSPAYAYRDATSGLAYYQFLADLEKQFDTRGDDVVRKLQTVVRLLFTRGGMLASVTLPQREFLAARGDFERFVSLLPSPEPKICDYPFTVSAANEAVVIPSKVQYVAKVADYRKAGATFSGKMLVLSRVVGRTYLWNRVRVMNGAYGSDMVVDRSGLLAMWSYRDPHLHETAEAYDESVKFLSGLEMSDRELAKAVIATIGELDKPLTPQEKGAMATRNYIAQITQADLQQTRDEVLAATVADLKAFSALLKKAMDQNHLCAFGGEEKIQEERKLFTTVTRMAK